MCQDCSSCCLTPFSEHTDSSLYTSGFIYSSMILVACILIPIWEIRKQNLTKKSDLRKALAPDLPYNGCKPMVWFQNVFRFSRGGKLCSHNIVCLVAQPCPTICDPMDCSLPGSSVHGISRQEHWSGQGSFARGSSWLRDRTWVSCVAGRFFTPWATRETLYYGGTSN